MKFIIAFFQAFLLCVLIGPAEAATPSCLDRVRPLEAQKDHIQSGGGMWGYFERHPDLREHSVKALSLDSLTNKLIDTLKYLCETQKGIPLSDLAMYLLYNVGLKGQDEFRAELIALGRTIDETETWIEYALYAKEHETRTLEINQIRETIARAKSKIDSYVKLAEEISEHSAPGTYLQKTKSLLDDLSGFLSDEPYLAQALEEISHVPYWDINESSGGS
ncbi:hypothetical protein UZ36_00350 [Candidatus Nitromaritima sp. SCGC AAA799-C22]|nr:hypothetical protein UZ36_00350 [Candidatus Nitromaritima sp. SCGC AAA799-C22]